MLIKFPTSKITIPIHPPAAILSSVNYHHRTKKKKKKNTNSEKYTFKSSFIFIDIVKGEKWEGRKKKKNTETKKPPRDYPYFSEAKVC